MTDHQPEQWYFDADTKNCPHDPEPDDDMSDEWAEWMDRHQSYDDGMLCLDAPAGEACAECSTDHGEMVPWALCKEREHRRPQNGITPTPDEEHQPVPVWVGLSDCLNRECDDYFDDDGNEIPSRDHCSHMREEQACSCQREPGGEYSDAPCPLVAAPSA